MMKQPFDGTLQKLQKLNNSEIDIIPNSSWETYVNQLYAFAIDADVFGVDPLHALKPFGMALWRTHAEMTKADEFFVQNVLGWYREQLDLTLVQSR